MLAPQRQQAILDLVHRLGGVRVSDLGREFGVSDMTVRRDLEALAERGLVDKVHGGATVMAGPAGTGVAGTDAGGTAAGGTGVAGAGMVDADAALTEWSRLGPSGGGASSITSRRKPLLLKA